MTTNAIVPPSLPAPSIPEIIALASAHGLGRVHHDHPDGSLRNHLHRDADMTMAVAAFARELLERWGARV